MGWRTDRDECRASRRRSQHAIWQASQAIAWAARRMDAAAALHIADDVLDISIGHLWGQVVYAVLCLQVCVKRERGWRMAGGHLPEQYHCSHL